MGYSKSLPISQLSPYHPSQHTDTDLVCVRSTILYSVSYFILENIQYDNKLNQLQINIDNEDLNTYRLALLVLIKTTSSLGE